MFGGGNQGNVSGNSYVYFGGGAVNQTIYGGGCEADVKGNTHVTMLEGYVNDGVCGGGLSGSVGNVIEREALPSNHSNHTSCVQGKPKKFADTPAESLPPSTSSVFRWSQASTAG